MEASPKFIQHWGDGAVFVVGTVLTAPKEIETKNHSHYAKFSVVYGEGDGMLIAVKVWSSQAAEAMMLQKGDRVIAIGQYDVNAFNGREYKEITVGAFGGRKGLILSPDLMLRMISGDEKAPTNERKERKKDSKTVNVDEFADINSSDIPF